MDIPVEFPWYALRIKTRNERVVASALFGKGYEVFLPVYHSRRQWSDRMKQVESPLFPGYLFCRFNVQLRLPVLTTPGIMQVVGIGKTPLPVSEDEISAIQAFTAARLDAEPWPFLQAGERVVIERGPLSGVEGILVSTKKTQRLIISVTLLQRSVAVEIDGNWVSPVNPRRGCHSSPQSRPCEAQMRSRPAAFPVQSRGSLPSSASNAGNP